VRDQLAAKIAFQDAQALSQTKWKDATAALRSLTARRKDTEFGRRARAHLQALGENVR
jgi:hypothetical protein